MTYKRNQVEEAVWRFISRDAAGRELTTTFRTRVKRLMELDRSSDDGIDFAFQEGGLTGRGNEASFSEFNVFCVAAGMVLQNAGFKQGEVVQLMRHARWVFNEAWHSVWGDGSEGERRKSLPHRQRLVASDRPDLPAFEMDGIRYADRAIYILLNHVEAVDATAGTSTSKPALLTPLVVKGGDALLSILRERMWAHPGHFILEASVMAERIRTFLKSSEPRRRGPGS